MIISEMGGRCTGSVSFSRLLGRLREMLILEGMPQLENAVVAEESEGASFSLTASTSSSTVFAPRGERDKWAILVYVPL